jgi:transcriptional regulator with XRE-family HTH domain
MRLRSRLILIALIDDAGISERELARRAGLSHSTVNHLVTSRRLSSSLPTALSITKALGCPIGALFVAESAGEQETIDKLATSRDDPPRRS